MGVLKFISFSFLLYSTVYANYDCADSICGNDHFDIRFPFRLEGQNHQNCGYPGFSLNCSNQGRAILSLPGAGDFLVRDINYLSQEIQLYDPFNCLPNRLISFNTSSTPSPFKAVFYRNYTFLTCSTNSILSRFNVISCLSNSSTSTLATSSLSIASQMVSLYRCRIINTLPVPVSSTSQYEPDFFTDLNTDLLLTWDEPNCKDCEAKQRICGFKNATTAEIQCFDSPEKGSNRGLRIWLIIILCIHVPITIGVIYVFCVICFDCNRFSRTVAAIWKATAAAIQNITTPATVEPPVPQAVAIGLDKLAIESYTKVVLGESRRVPGPNHVTCPICLAEFHPKEIVRCMPECDHRFHAECIDEWLKISGTCPVCRNNPYPSHVNSP